MKALAKSLLLSCLLAQCSTGYAKCDGRQLPQLDMDSAVYWSKEKLTGDDAPFHRIRQNIDRMIAEGKNKTDLAVAFKQAAQKKPQDAQAQFRWAYAAYKAQYDEQDSQKREQLLCGIYEWMGLPKYPRAFEYARLRFIIAQLYSTWNNNQNLTNLGKRLAQRVPKDYDLKFFVTRALTKSSVKADWNIAVQYARDIQRAFPKRPSSYSLLGEAYAGRFYGFMHSSDADKAIASYRKYLELAPTNYEFRKAVPRIIQNIESGRKLYKDKGWLKP